MAINNTILVGRLTRDPALTYTPSGLAVLKFSIAQSYKKKDPDGQYANEPQFFDITMLGKYAETMKPYLTKGKQVGVSGKLRQQRWTDKDTGKGRSKIEVLCQDLELMGSKRDGEKNSQYEGEYVKNDPAGSTDSVHNAINDEYEDDIPF